MRHAIDLKNNNLKLNNLLHQMDVYSFGVLLCEMCTRELPIPLELHSQVRRVTGVLRELIERCTEGDPNARPTISEVTRRLQQLE